MYRWRAGREVSENDEKARVVCAARSRDGPSRRQRGGRGPGCNGTYNTWTTGGSTASSVEGEYMVTSMRPR